MFVCAALFRCRGKTHEGGGAVLNIVQMRTAAPTSRRKRLRLLVSRSRRNRLVAVAADETEELEETLTLDQPVEEESNVVTLDVATDDEPPFDPPDEDDIFGVEEVECEAAPESVDEAGPFEALAEALAEAAEAPLEAAFVEPKPAAESLSLDAAPEGGPLVAETPQEETQAEFAFVTEDARSHEARAAAEIQCEVGPEDPTQAEIEDDDVMIGALSAPADDEEPPFDAPDEDDQLFTSGTLQRVEEQQQPQEWLPEGASDRRSTLAAERSEGQRAAEQPVPAIKIYAAWERDNVSEMFERLVADPRMARADFEVERGGIERAIERFRDCSSPDLLVLDTTLNGGEMLACLDRLAHVLEQGAKLIVIGAVNDIGLLRELATRGISDYMVAPMRRDDLVRAICALYTGEHNSRVIAVIGASGGVGASTLAHNIAWSIAERQECAATLIDLDLSFGTANFSFKDDAAKTVADVLGDESADDTFIEHAAVKPTKRLRVLPAPANLEPGVRLDASSLDQLLLRARRLSPFVVLDLPHVWSGWVKQILASADDVVVVSAPDLASLRNTKNMLEQFRHLRPRAHAPSVVLSMTGMPKRPEILAKDFAQSLDTSPVASFAFEPALFGMAAISGKMIGDSAPDSKAALQIDELATSLTGRPVVSAKKPTRRATPKGADAIQRMQAPEFNVRKPSVPRAAPQPGAEAPKRAPPQPMPAPPVPRVENADQPLASAPEPKLELLPLTLDQAIEAPSHDYIEKARDAALTEAKPQRAAARENRAASFVLSLALIASALHVETARVSAADRPFVEPAPYSTVEAQPAPLPAPIVVDPAAIYADAVELLQTGQAEAGAAEMQRAAEAGHPMAQYRLALAYERGEGVGVDLAAARIWTERAAASGVAMAMHNLGVYNARGEGAARDEAAAFRWFRQAAEFGVPDSQYNLGILYERGRGVSEDKSEALFWFLLAARQGDAQATARVAELEAVLTPEDVRQARARVDAFRPRGGAPQPAGEDQLTVSMATAG